MTFERDGGKRAIVTHIFCRSRPFRFFILSQRQYSALRSCQFLTLIPEFLFDPRSRKNHEKGKRNIGKIENFFLTCGANARAIIATTTRLRTTEVTQMVRTHATPKTRKTGRAHCVRTLSCVLMIFKRRRGRPLLQCVIPLPPPSPPRSAADKDGSAAAAVESVRQSGFPAADTTVCRSIAVGTCALCPRPSARRDSVCVRARVRPTVRRCRRCVCVPPPPPPFPCTCPVAGGLAALSRIHPLRSGCHGLKQSDDVISSSRR